MTDKQGFVQHVRVCFFVPLKEEKKNDDLISSMSHENDTYIIVSAVSIRFYGKLFI
jgi:hypothetical protein